MRCDLQLGESLHRAGDKIEQIYFPEIGFISALSVLTDGQPLEIGLIGAEGGAGVSVIFGATTSYSETMCQTAGAEHRIAVDKFKQLFEQAPRLRDLLLRYVHVFHVQVAQTVACNALEQRCWRWLLMTRDRMQSNDFLLTQEFLAMMLGVARPGVSIAAGGLQRAGLITYSRGNVAILDTAALKKRSCECYGVSKREFDRLLGLNPN